MTRAYDDEAMKPLPLLGPRPPWWRKWMILFVLIGSGAAVPVLMWFLG